MDALGVIGLAGGIVAIAATTYGIGRKQVSATLNDRALAPVKKDLEQIDRTVHKHANRLALIPEKPDDVYVRKEALAPQLASMTAALERIERNQEALTQRFMDGAVGP